MIQKSHDDRMLWAQFDSLEMGTGWDDTDILKPQIMVESVYGDSHPGSYHLNQMVEQAVYGVYEKGGKPAKYYATDICDGCAQGHDGMTWSLAPEPLPTWWKSTPPQCPGTASSSPPAATSPSPPT